jgi:hypothetical protein
MGVVFVAYFTRSGSVTSLSGSLSIKHQLCQRRHPRFSRRDHEQKRRLAIAHNYLILFDLYKNIGISARMRIVLGNARTEQR